MRERSEAKRPPKPKTYIFEMTLINFFRNYTMYSSCSLSLRRHATLTGSPSFQYLPTRPFFPSKGRNEADHGMLGTAHN